LKLYGYTRISSEEEVNDTNSSIESQEQIIRDYTAKQYPGQKVNFFSDRSVSGFSFDKREQYNLMRSLLVKGDVLLVKDYSRFSRNDIEASQEMQHLKDSGIILISISDGIIDDSSFNGWLLMKLKSIFNEIPVRETSSKVRQVVASRQKSGQWVCAVPYGYRITNSKAMTYEIDAPAAQIVREIYNHYCEGWGYKKICNDLTDRGIPTPTQNEIALSAAQGKTISKSSSGIWAIPTVQKMLENDFYIGVLRQHKYTRSSINGADKRTDKEEHIVIENAHEAIIDDKTWAFAQELRKQRTSTNYRGEKKYPTDYSGYLFCGSCGKPMFSRSNPRLTPSYICGTYQRRGLKGCKAHTVFVPQLDHILKSYIKKVMDNSQSIIAELNEAIKEQPKREEQLGNAIDTLGKQLEETREQLKQTLKRKVVETVGKDDATAQIISETYADIEAELAQRIQALEKQINENIDTRNGMIQANRSAKTVMDVFQDILDKPKLDKRDIGLIVDRITVYDEYTEVRLKADVDTLFHLHEPSINIISEGDPLEIYTRREGEVIFKKYSTIGGLEEFAALFCDTLSHCIDFTAAITDRDTVIAAAGSGRRELLGKSMSQELSRLLEERHLYHPSQPTTPACLDCEAYTVALAAPIICQGDLLGAVLFLTNSGKQAQDAEEKLAQTVAVFLSKNLET